MPLVELLSSYSPMYPEGYDWTLTAKYLLENEPKLLEALRESIRKKGWREPVVLSEPHELTEDSPPCIMNGTHRVVLAMLDGLVTVPVATRSELPPESDKPLLVARIRPLKEQVLTDDEDDLLIDSLRSWELDEDTWITSSACFGSMHSWDVLLDFDDERRCGDLEVSVRRILAETFPRYEFSVSVFPDPLEDED